MRERGLKHQNRAHGSRRPLSLPVRERGLKLMIFLQKQLLPRSLPVRERGLKLAQRQTPNF